MSVFLVIVSLYAQGHGVGMGARPHKGKFLPHKNKNRIPEDSVQGMPLDHNGHHDDVEAGRPVTHSHYLDHEAHHADIDAGRPVTH